MNKLKRFSWLLCLFLSSYVHAQTPDYSFHVPEFAGTFRLGIIQDDKSVWAKDCRITSTSKANYTTYTLKNELINKGEIILKIRPLDDTQGIVMQLEAQNIPSNIQLCWAYGGASGNSGQAPIAISPEACKDNVFSIEGHAFTVYYGTSRALKIFHGIAPLDSDLRLADAHQQEKPYLFLHSGKKTNAPALAALCSLKNNTPVYFCFYKQNPKADYNYYMLPELFKKGKIQKQTTEEWMKSTPD